MYNNKIRREDEKCADIVSKFLEKHFYNKTKDYKKIDEKEQQLKGVDVIFVLNDKKYICDEKAAIRYVNKNLQTFAFELSFLGKADRLIDGWLISSTKINNSFLCIWIDKAEYDLIEDIDDIQELEIALIDKSKLMDYLQNLGWTVSKLNIKAEKMRKNPKEPQGEIETNGCRFVCSRKLAEKPVNVLVSREKLKEIADYTEVFKIDDLHELTIDEIGIILKNMIVDGNDILPYRYFSFMIKNNDGETEYKIIRNALASTATLDTSINLKNYNNPELIGRIQEFITIYGPIYKIY